MSLNVDTITLLFHGRNYAIMIGGGENLTVSKEGKVSSDIEATYIGELEKKRINYLKLYTCNPGLIDIIDLTVERKINKDSGGEYIYQREM